MKQLLLRVDDELHARLTEQARAAGKSVNALANEILGLGIDPANLSRRERLKLRLISVGDTGRNRAAAARTPLPPITVEEREALRERALASMRGVGPLADDLIDFERDER